jgi:hypothetical protein
VAQEDERLRSINTMAEFDFKQLDITKQNVAVEKVLDATVNPRHRYMLQAYLRQDAGRRYWTPRSLLSTRTTASI